MTQLHITEISVSGSPLGSLNPYPQLPASADKAFTLKVDEQIPERLRAHLGYGVSSAPMDPCLPYLLQDDYGRELRPTTLRCAKISNEKIEATILLDYGARVWKLWDKVNQRDLVYENPVFQPANFAVRNAWMAGGIEWNVGVRGHGSFSADTLFAATLEGPDGAPVLRVWEYERTRKIVFQMDFFLCGEEPRLAVHIGVYNTTDQVVPLYWWSNIAVREEPGSRVVAQGKEAIYHAYGGRLSVLGVDAPMDLSFLKNHENVGDYYYYGRANEQPWISAVGADGYGLYQTSTRAQKGRKLFAWGRTLAAQNWQKMLSHEVIPYFEIQAGLAPTQYGSESLHPGQRIEWVETYGPIQVDPGLAASGAPDSLRQSAAGRIDRFNPAEALEGLLSQHRSTFDQTPEEIIQTGSGWGALELQGGAQRDHWECMPGAIFPDSSLRVEQAPWMEVLRGKKPDLDPDGSAPSYMIDTCWLDRLDASSSEETAWSQLQRGIIAYTTGDTQKAKLHFTNSLQEKPSAVAHVCLFQLHRNFGEHAQALSHVEKAMALKPNDPRVRNLLVNALIKVGNSSAALDLIERATGGAEPQGRLRMAAISAHLQAGQLLEARTLLLEVFAVPDLREAELSLSQLWQSLSSIEGEASADLPEHLVFVADPNLMARADDSHSVKPLVGATESC